MADSNGVKKEVKMESGMSEIQATVAAAGAAVKKEVKAEAKVERSSTTGMTATAKKLKKETSETKEEEQYYSKPGQRLPTPSPGSGSRVFYESLYGENPNSEMAFIWLVEHGCFDLEKSKAVYPLYLELKGKLPPSEPNKRRKVSRSNSRSARVLDEPVVDAGVSVGGMESVGRVTM